MKKVTKLNLASGNVRTLLDSTTSISGRPERRKALVARELTGYRVDIAALSETCLSDKGQLTKIGSGYTLFWCGSSSDKRHEAGVSFSIKDHLIKKVDRNPEGLNDRLMKLKFPLGRKSSATLINAYAPNMTNTDEVKEKFHEELEALISAIPLSEKLILLGDFNAPEFIQYP